jgi:ankyrin repeat protein
MAVHRACKLGAVGDEVQERLALQKVQHMLRARADPNEGDDRGETPLLEAVLHGREKLYSLLVEYGAKNCVVDARLLDALE